MNRRASLAMTRSDDKSVFQGRERSRIKSAMRGKGRECVVKDGSGYYGHRVRVRLSFTGLGAWAWPKREGRSPKRRTKCLTFTERRLSFTFGEGTPRPEGQAFRAAVRWAIHFGLDSLLLSYQEESTNKTKVLIL